ncbi:MAG: SAM-dependent DNA methyltransferase, partial [Pseudonocardia sp.]|nr:SAM-dependent DNA methyltransferase [Pseudonocardia sp.]
KVFSTRDFGYQRITVERPLRLRFEVGPDALAELAAGRALSKFPDRDSLIEAMRPLIGRSSVKRAEFATRLREALAGLPALPGPVSKAVWAAVSVADPSGELQVDRFGSQLPDPDLRDHENVPLDEDIEAYVAREVLPHVPDAWIDHAKTRIGYEIPFTRHFYVYTPPRPLAEIDAELRSLESEIQRLLAEVTE